MIIRNIILRSSNNCFLKTLSNTQNFHVASLEQLRPSYPLLLTNNRNENYSTGLILGRNNCKVQNQHSSKVHAQSTKSEQFSSKSDTQSNKNEDIKELNVRSNCEKVNQNNTEAVVLTKKEKFKKTLKEYGGVVIVFHIGISLISLGTCYLLVSSGLDITKIIQAVGLDSWITPSELAANAGTFAVAYAIHKVFAPVRITITVGSIPFVVRYLRKIGFLKK